MSGVPRLRSLPPRHATSTSESPFGAWTTRLMAGQRCPAFFHDAWSDVEALAFEPLVHVGDELAVAVEQERRHAIALAEHFLGRLAPARMRHRRIHVCPETVFAGLQLLPEADGTLGHEADFHDRFDRLESVFPGKRQADRRAEGFAERLAVGAGDHEGEIVVRLRHGDALDIRPGIPELPEAGSDALVHERF